MSIQNLKFDEIKEVIKENQKNIFIALLIFLIATLSFGLGYLTNREFTHSPIVIEKCSSARITE
jgi:Na+/H+ antiporter NhaC